jgi:glutamyl-Q tRNA(Asp) synthetase
MFTTTRFAPSPTGRLHLGHAFAALFAAEKAAGGRFLVRLEDIDGTRARPEYESGIFEDLAWLGLTWEQPVIRQSEHLQVYRGGLDVLQRLGLLYACFCTRKAIQAEITAAGHAPHGPDGPLYPGTCRSRSASEAEEKIARGEAYALRLHVEKAMDLVGKDLRWEDRAQGAFMATPALFGDVVLARKDTPASYHLAVVLDDARQGVSLVTRGEDLLPATHLHRLLIELLSLPVPEWEHHRLILDEQGRRLAKRDDAKSLRSLRELGWTAERVREVLML